MILKLEICFSIFRWDINSINHLPEYMKLCYVALLDVYNEIEEEMEKDGYQYRLHYAIEAVGYFAFTLSCIVTTYSRDIYRFNLIELYLTDEKAC